MIHQSFLSSSTRVVTCGLCSRGLSRSKPEWSRAALLRVDPTNSLPKLLQRSQNCNLMHGKVVMGLWIYSAILLGGEKKRSNLCGYHGNQQVPSVCPGMQGPAPVAPWERGAPQTMGAMLELHPSWLQLLTSHFRCTLCNLLGYVGQSCSPPHTLQPMSSFYLGINYDAISYNSLVSINSLPFMILYS